MYDDIINFIENQWHIHGGNKLIKSVRFEKIICDCYSNLVKNKFPSKSPFMFRLAGQSGSGKTTQLLPAVESVIPQNFIKISVRDFALEHPQYSKFNKDMVREKTNGFALYLLFRVLGLLIKNNYNILFEVTLLDYNFEKHLLDLASKYTIHFHILSIPLKKSNEWIENRQRKTGRVVLSKSINYFYKVLPLTLEKILKLNLKMELYLWNGFETKPYTENILNKFKYYRNLNFIEYDEDLLLTGKKEWFRKKYEKLRQNTEI
ncbi:MAG: zeta toxin family protein [Rickettsiales bacterium]|jgi:predicted kinase|nr:zeta toxin family protein [Rickettsiales bacterium]